MAEIITGKQVIQSGVWICPNPICPAILEEWADRCHECGTEKPKDAEIYFLVKVENDANNG